MLLYYWHQRNNLRENNISTCPIITKNREQYQIPETILMFPWEPLITRHFRRNDAEK